METTLVAIPHGSKMSVRDLPPGHDPADPPLTVQARQAAAQLVDRLNAAYGAPGVIAVSPRLRARETAEPALKRFCQGKWGDPLVITANCLAQPDSGELDTTNPAADQDGMVLYGKRSSLEDWYSWTVTSLAILNAAWQTTKGPIWVYTHRPIVAMLRWLAKCYGLWLTPTRQQLDVLNPTLLPFVPFALTRHQHGGIEAIFELVKP